MVEHFHGVVMRDEMIIYHKDQINMKNREFRTLSSILSRSSMNRQTPKSDEMSFNQTEQVEDQVHQRWFRWKNINIYSN